MNFGTLLSQYPVWTAFVVLASLAGLACAGAAIARSRRHPAEATRTLAIGSFVLGVLAPAVLGQVWTQLAFRKALATTSLIVPEMLGEALHFQYTVALHPAWFGTVAAAVALPLAAWALISFYAASGRASPIVACAVAACLLGGAGWILTGRAARMMDVPLDPGSVYARCLGTQFDRMPVSNRARPFDHRGQFVVVTGREILLDWKPVVRLDGGAVRAADKEGGRPDALLITPLFDAIRKKAGELKEHDRLTRHLSNDRMIFAAVESASERTLTEVFYTAGQAGVGFFIRAVRSQDDPKRLYLQYPPVP